VTERLTPEQVQAYWTEQASQHGQAPAASWSDLWAIDLEIREILNHIADGDRVLDVGCANGYTTTRLAQQRDIEIRGLDYIPEMIDQARARLLEPEFSPLKISFDVGDINSLREPDGAYDKVVVVRVLINLSDWESQVAALRQCARVLRPGGLLLLSEATLQGWRRLNALRREWGLDEVPMPSFNRYIDEDALLAAATPELEPVRVVNFSSTYFVGTRVLKPLLIEALGGRIEAANPDMEWNRWFAGLPAWGDYGTQKLFVFRRATGGNPGPR
jgi:2-polyprenyl-3-methyl-5-hydroxy-6-metoxy-1,4-benzoquinol methylase